MATAGESREIGTPARAEVQAPREPHLFRFGLRHFFLFVSVAVLLLGAMAMIRGGWAVGLAFLAALVVAHVSATFVGTRLRDSSREIQRWRAGLPGAGAEAIPPRRILTAAELAAFSATPLARHERAPRRTVVATLVGLAAGAPLGAWGISQLGGSETTTAGYALGALSCAVMGAWLALLAAHFMSVSRRAWSDANADPAGTPPRRRAGWFGRGGLNR